MADDEPIKKKSRKSKEKTEDAGPEFVPKKMKKRKRDAEAEADDAILSTEPVKKKKHKNKTGLLDPSEDSSLSEQAQKALSYAFTQFRHPKRWKFQKARQNWLIRNAWSAESIPDAHMPLVLKYLTNVQGGVRENLVKTCQSYLTVPIVVDPAAGETATEAAKPVSDLKALRARELLDVLEASPL
ncbi:hypothetical protein CPB85DRAFT_141310 [Mucidula mucida]|nr:hypothetical protein CPB85DRAFT_141310 [Mucidula mucida]